MISLRTVGLAATAGALFAAGALPAGATPSPRAEPHSVIRSDVGAGYYAYPGLGNLASVSATTTVPAFSCSGPHITEGVFPGIFIYDGSGNLTQHVDVKLLCKNGQTSIADEICIAGSSEGCVGSLGISPGDRLVATFAETTFATQGEIYDLTTHQIDSIYDGTPAPTADSTVFIGDAGPAPFGYSNHVPVFTSIPFKKVQVDGYYLIEYVGDVAVLKTLSLVQVRTSHLLGDGDAFNTTFVHI